MPYTRVVLLGFMASGKTAIGRALAARLGWAHVDLDHEIEAGAGAPVEEIFREHGEAYFRRLEVETTPRLLRSPHIVLSPGGGWVTNPGLFESLPPDSLTVWLRVTPEEVLRRVEADPDGPVRPLLQASDPLARIRRLMEERAALYRKAAFHVETAGRSTEEIVDEVEGIVRESRVGRQ
jgi:shikimate kinase